MSQSLRKAVKDARKCENLNDPIDTYVVDYVAMFFSRIFIKLHIIPNVITVLSGVVGVAGGVMLMFDRLYATIAGVLLIILSAVFDACDGQVARLTKRYSNLGRTLDGAADACVYISIYAALCVRLFNANILFTDAVWGFWIILVAAATLYIFGAQSRTADYFKHLHMYMIKNEKGNELSRTAEIKKQIKASKRFSFERFRLSMYLLYTGAQEKDSPATQKMLDKLEENGGVSDAASETFSSKSRKYVRYTNFLTFNLRTIVLFILLFLPWAGVLALYFPFVLFVLEPIRIAIILKYEKLSKKVYAQELKSTETAE